MISFKELDIRNKSFYKVFSVIIPTYNEEKYLPKLLQSLSVIKRDDFEIIVSDAFSKDKTREVAKEFGVQVVDGGPISIGRNNGAAAAKFDIFVFLDSDVTVDPDLFERIEKSFIKRKLDIGSAYFHRDTGKKSTDFAYGFWDMSKRIRQYFKKPDATGGCIVATREAFEAVDGFDPMRKIGNDTDFVHRVRAAGYKFRMLNIKIHSSTRRYKKVGVARVMLGNFIAGTVGRENQRAQAIAQFIYGGWGKHDEKLPENERNLINVFNQARKQSIEISNRVLVYGGTGFVGESIVDELLKKGYKPILLVRDENKILKRWNDHVDFEIGDVSNIEDTKRIVRKYTPSIVIYSIGIIKENKNTTFEDAHFNWPKQVAEFLNSVGINRFIYISANGVRMDGTPYQRTKWELEKYLHISNLDFTIFRPGIVWDIESESDFNQQLDMLTKFRIVPMIGFGSFKFAPIERVELAKVISEKISNHKNGSRETLKVIGPEVKTFKTIVKEYAKYRGRRVIILPIPVFLIKIGTKLLGRFKWFPLTNDQLKMILEGNY